MTTKDETRLSELRTALDAVCDDAHGAPQSLRRHVVEFARGERQRGRTGRATAAALGIHETTLCRWAREAGATPRSGAGPAKPNAFRVVEVASPSVPACPTMLAPSSAPLRVAHAPSGLVIDGLDIDALARLLRSLS